MQKIATNCYLINSNGHILLAMKKRGFGVGKWNGSGGKIQPGETPEDTAVREVKEEIGIHLDKKDLQKIGEVSYRNPDPNWGMYVHIYVAKNWKGEPVETEEMKPQWFDPKDVLALPAWSDFKYLFAKIVAQEKFKAEFMYTDDGEGITSYNITDVISF